MPDRVGTQLGNYRLLRLLGRGGTAEVYLGEHIYLKRYAALKVLRTKLFDEEAEQFLREAQMLSSLNHPHIVRVLDFAVQDTQPFLVTEYAPHGTLRTRHPRNVAIPASDVAVYVQQVASALHYAHERRVVHRDIKPENMLVGEHQEVLLADFGIAILASSTHQWYAQEKDNALAGTTLYMAPEQLQGQAQSASDQYALAVVAYEWLCGRRPFEGTLQEIAVQHLSMPPASLRRWQPDLPLALDDVVLRALAKDPGERFPSVRDFADALLSAASCAGLSMASIAVAEHEVLTTPIVVTGGAAATGQTDEPQRLSAQTKSVTDEQQTLPLVEPGRRPLWKVPDALTSLIGRERETRDICALLAQPGVRLVTLLGPGGIGKTRLSIALAGQLRDGFADGVCFVALATATDAEQMMTAIAHELELQEQERSYREAVLEFLREKEMLLLLDNFEQLVSAAPVLETLLATCPRVKLLVSSRVVLRLPSDRQFRLSSLAVPDMATLPESAVIAAYPAVALFVQRARVLVPSFQVTPTNAPLLAEICARLDGIPLAIELAAARIKLLPPQALLPRLTHSLQVLTRGSTTLPERQQTLRRTIQWSYDLLDAWEQRVFRLLSVFAGSFTLQAVEELYAAFYRGESTAGSVIDMVEALIDSSLVLPPGQEDETEEPRLALLETVREYSQERLTEHGEQEIGRRVHAELFLHLAEEAATQLAGEQQARWLERLEREHNNLRAAMAWMLETPDEDGEDTASRREMALRLGSAMSLFWSARGYLREGRELMNRALSESAGVSLAIKAQAFMIASDLNMRLGDLDRGEALLQQSLQCFRTLEDEGKVANCLRSLGWIAHQKNEAERASTLYEEALALYKALDNRQGIANTLLNTAFLMQTQGDYERALALLEDVLPRQRALDNRVAIFSVLYQLGQVRFGLHGARDAPHIRALLEEGLELAREVGNRRGIASLQGMLSWLAYSEGKLAEARQLVEDCLLFFKDGGDRVLAGHYVALLGQIVTAQGDYADAQALFKEGLAIAREIGDNKNEIVPDCLEGMAELALLQGYHPWAVRLWGAAAHCRDMIGIGGMPSQRAVQERQMESVREFLGAQSFEALLKEGRTLSPEEAFVARGALSQRQPPTAQATPRQGSTKKKKIPAYPAGLSAREVDILRLVADGLSDIQVAEQLVISPRTVTTHLTSIYNKLGVNSRAAATRFAVEHHLV